MTFEWEVTIYHGNEIIRRERIITDKKESPNEKIILTAEEIKKISSGFFEIGSILLCTKK